MLEGLPDQLSPQTDGASAPPPRRVSADSFRALAARLGAKKAAAPVAKAAPTPDKAAMAEMPVGQIVEAAPASPIELPQLAEPTIVPAAVDIATTELPAAEVLAEAMAQGPEPETVVESPLPQELEFDAAPAETLQTVEVPPPPEPAIEPEPVAPPQDQGATQSSLGELMGSLEAKFGNGVTLRRKPVASELDPFAVAALVPAPATAPPASYVVEEADEEAADTARALLDIMSGGAAAQPQERALASDTVLRLIPRIPEHGLIALAERLSIMEHPPALIAARLIRDPRPSVAAALLERCPSLSDKDLLAVVAESNVEKHRLIARRRIISPALCEALIASGDESVLLTLTRNTGAAITHLGFQKLSERARSLPSIQAQLVTRPDTPAPIAFELFWMLPPVLRRLVLSRFLTDSETLNRILKLAMSVSDDVDASQPAPSQDQLEAFAGQLAWGNSQLAATLLAELAGIDQATALRIAADPEGEPLAVIFKMLGVSRAAFADLMGRIQASPSSVLNKDRNIEELQNIFDQLSPNKARVLVTYWDWSSRNTGPYALAA